MKFSSSDAKNEPEVEQNENPAERNEKLGDSWEMNVVAWAAATSATIETIRSNFKVKLNNARVDLKIRRQEKNYDEKKFRREKKIIVVEKKVRPSAKIKCK